MSSQGAAAQSDHVSLGPCFVQKSQAPWVKLWFCLVPQPARDMLLSPDHALFIDNILAQASALVNGKTIFRNKNVSEVFAYYHIELPTHALILAENTPVESFVDNVDRMAFDNWAEHEKRLGALPPLVEMPYPRVKSSR